MELSIVILNHNHKNLLKNCLKSLQEADLPSHELIITDNGSRDGSQEYLSRLKEEDPEIRIIFQQKEFGLQPGQQSSH